MIKKHKYCQYTHFPSIIRNQKYFNYGGERGIRTLDSIATIHAFQALRLEKSLGNTTINQYLFLITESVSVA